MRILAVSHRFAPDIGGIETATAALASWWSARGHAVVVVTATARDDAVARPYRVVRRPGAAAFLRLCRAADVVWHNNPSLPLTLAPLALGRPLVVTHQTWLTQPDGGVTWRERVKRAACALWTNVAISRAVAARLPVRCVVVPNPVPDGFGDGPQAGERDIDIAFVGRLVSDKGVNVLLHALALLHGDGPAPRVAIAGDGPERVALEAAAAALPGGGVRFLGSCGPAAVAALLRRARVLAVPSVWEEPLGIVALEGAAAGCVVVATDGGGLPEAAGPGAFLCRRGDAADLARALGAALRAPRPDPARTRAHLGRFRADVVGAAYEALFRGPEAC